MASLPAPTRSLVSQLRILWSDMNSAHPGGAPAPTEELVTYSRRCGAEMYLCAEALQSEVAAAAAAGGDRSEEEELEAELQRTQWATCIWELATLMLVQRPLVAGECLLPWWHRHLCDPAAEEAAHGLVAAAAPEAQGAYWPTLAALVAQGKTRLAGDLLRAHSALRAGGGDGGGGLLASRSTALLLRLDTLLDTLPRLTEPEIFDTHDEAAAPSLGAQEAMSCFRLRWRVWSEDVASLVADLEAAPAGDAEATAMCRVARVLASADGALGEASGGSWHGELVGRLLLEQPVRLRWQLSGVFSPPPGPDAFEACLVALFRDDPYAAMAAIRQAFGDGWLIAHLWDLLCRARAVRSDPLEGSPLSLRQYFLLQYAKALGGVPPLWQLAAAYGADASPQGAAPVRRTVLDASSTRPVGGDLLSEPGAAAEARAWLGDLLLSAAQHDSAAPACGTLHAHKVRKLLGVCEKLGLTAAADAVLRARGGASRAAALGSDVAVAKRASLPLADGRAVEQALLEDLASRALDEALGGGGGAGGAGAGPSAVAELRAMLRSGGVAGPDYYAGPGWLPAYVELLELLGRLPADAPPAAAQAAALRGLLTSLCAAPAAAGVAADARPATAPLPLSRRLLSLACGLDPLSSAARFQRCCLAGEEPLALSCAEAYSLLAHNEQLRASQLYRLAPAEGADSRPHSLAPDEQARSATIAASLAAAVLRESEAASPHVCWTAGC